MNYFAFAQASLRSWRWNTLTATAGFSLAIGAIGTAQGQIDAGRQPIARVELTPAAFLPANSSGSIQTTIATDFDGQSKSDPWHVSLTSLGRSEGMRGTPYTVQVTNISSAPINLPIGTDGNAVWSTCQKDKIAEVNIALRVSGQIAPAANLPIAHSCAALSSSYVSVVPGASVIFQGTLAGSFRVPEGAGVSAVMSVCSASYNLDASSPVTTRHCEVHVSSSSVTQSMPVQHVSTLPRVK